nr:hypothetical protein BdHM001_23160 [Bdellovibrio sp. HM001]
MKNRSLNFKLALVIGILVTGSLLIAGIGLSRMDAINTALDQIVTEKSARVSIAKDIKALFYLQLLNERSFVIEESREGMQDIASRLEKRGDDILKKIDELSAISGEQGKAEAAQFKETYLKWWAVNEQVRKTSFDGDNKGAMALVNSKGNELRNEGEALVDSVVSRNEQRMLDDAAKASADFKNARFFMILLSSLAILIGVSIATFILISLSKAINTIIENLSGSSSQVAGASQQIASSAEGLSQATTEQASSLEETVATIEELSSMVRVNSDNAHQAAQLSTQTSEVASRGEQEIHALVSSMQEISNDSQKIAEIINVIDDIAFQTNLLALNAAVEAARAGEQGKGFAVVAEAVRGLAQRSSSAAKDIEALIKSSVQRIEVGSDQAEKSGAVLGEIVSAVKKVTALNNEIAAASKEQSDGIMQISKAMNQLDQVTQVNAASSEEAAASAEELSAQSENMTLVIQELVAVVKGGQTSVSPYQGEVAKPRAVAAPVASTAPKKGESTNHEDLLPLNSAS